MSLVLVEEVEELLLVLPDGQLDPLPEELEVARREGQRRVRVHLQEEDIMRTQWKLIRVAMFFAIGVIIKDLLLSLK